LRPARDPCSAFDFSFRSRVGVSTIPFPPIIILCFSSIFTTISPPASRPGSCICSFFLQTALFLLSPSSTCSIPRCVFQEIRKLPARPVLSVVLPVFRVYIGLFPPILSLGTELFVLPPFPPPSSFWSAVLVYQPAPQSKSGRPEASNFKVNVCVFLDVDLSDLQFSSFTWRSLFPFSVHDFRVSLVRFAAVPSRTEMLAAHSALRVS